MNELEQDVTIGSGGDYDKLEDVFKGIPIQLLKSRHHRSNKPSLYFLSSRCRETMVMAMVKYIIATCPLGMRLASQDFFLNKFILMAKSCK